MPASPYKVTYGTGLSSHDAYTVALILGLTILLAIVALAIDRRSLLVAGLGYLGAAIIFVVFRLPVGEEWALLAAPAGLGILIVVLGIAWRKIRATLMEALPQFSWKNRLPPYRIAP
ncbi:MAG: hypothetical protein ACREC6_03895 [Hyphomicrobiaceae bacterium]